MAEALQHRQGEPGRLAGAGLGRGHHVVALKHGRDAGQLDGGRGAVALGRHGLEQGFRKTELLKLHGEGRHRGGEVRGRIGGSAPHLGSCTGSGTALGDGGQRHCRGGGIEDRACAARCGSPAANGFGRGGSDRDAASRTPP